MHSEIRKHYFLDQYVIISPKRNKRPHKVFKKEEDQLKECYFCPELLDKPDAAKTILRVNDNDGKWKIKVVDNLYPALTQDNLKAYGIQEVVVETPEHDKEIHELPLNHIVDILDVYIKRYKELQKTKGIRYTLVFKNEGGKAGASIAHTHSQVIALPMIPPKIAEESAAIDDYVCTHSTCPYCDIIKKERHGPRKIWEDDHLFVLAPFASDSPYGVWFIPKRHVSSIVDLYDVEKESIARAFKKVLKRLDDIDVSYNYFFQNSLEVEGHHMIIKLSPRPNIWAGLELGTGIIINPVPPEEAAKFYNEG